MAPANPATFGSPPVHGSAASNPIQSYLLTTLDAVVPTDADSSSNARQWAKKLGLGGVALVLVGGLSGAGVMALDSRSDLGMPLIILTMIVWVLAGFALLFAGFAFLASLTKGNDDTRKRIFARDYHGVEVSHDTIRINGIPHERWAVVLHPRIVGQGEPITLPCVEGAAQAEEVARLLSEWLYAT